MSSKLATAERLLGESPLAYRCPNQLHLHGYDAEPDSDEDHHIRPEEQHHESCATQPPLVARLSRPQPWPCPQSSPAANRFARARRLRNSSSCATDSSGCGAGLYAFVGTNLWYGCYLGDPELSGGRARLVRELDRLQGIGVTNLRLLAGSETSPLVGAISRGITRAPRDWDEDLLEGLDFCLAEMANRDMRAVLFLSNYWQWSGSFAQSARSATGEPIPDPDLPRWPRVIGRRSCSLLRASTPPRPRSHLYRGDITHLLKRRTRSMAGSMSRIPPS